MKHKNIILSLVMVIFIGLMSVFSWFKPADEFSDSERRKLSQFPELSFKTVLSGKFMKNFEDYSLDQFPLRDEFRSLKANFAINIFNRSANNDIYTYGDHAAKMDYPYKSDSVSHAAQRFNYIYEKYLKDSGSEIYLSVIPDKNYFMADEAEQLSIDYDRLVTELRNGTDFAEYIDIFPLLELDDYYLTDAHWSQENILPVAEKLIEAMGGVLDAQFEEKSLEGDFYGVYYGQSALKLKADKISYLDNPVFESLKITDFQNGKEIPVYNPQKAAGKDPYEFFLNGPLSLIEIENPEAESDKELIIFRDSFTSSLAPLLIPEYSKITLVDIRYMHPDILGKYIDFSNKDVLFIYSTGVLNNSETIK